MNAQPNPIVTPDDAPPGAALSAVSPSPAADAVIQSLTGLRFYAAFTVFLSHMYHFGYFGLADPVRLVLAGAGHLGVSLFYVLSGFVLFLRYHDRMEGPGRLKSFYVARLARIYPAFVATALLAIPIELFSPYRAQMAWTLGANATLTHCLTPQTCGRLNDVGWSVGVEAAFYALFPLLLAAMRGRQGLWLGAALLACIGGIHLAAPGSFWATDRFFLNRAPEFFCGMLAAAVFLRGVRLPGLAGPKSLALWVCGLGVFLALSPLTVRFLGVEASYYFWLTPPCALLIYALAQGERRGLTLGALTTGLVVFGGDISYSFYLIHNLLLRYLRHGALAAFHLRLDALPLLAQLSLVILVLGAALWGSSMLYAHVEKPFRRKIRTLLG